MAVHGDVVAPHCSFGVRETPLCPWFRLRARLCRVRAWVGVFGLVEERGARMTVISPNLLTGYSEW